MIPGVTDGLDAPGWRQLRTTALDTGVPPPRIGELCIELAEVAGAGISVMTAAGNSGIVYASDETSAQIEELQFVLGEGPCMDAYRDGGPVFVADLEDPAEGVTDRWPGFVHAAGVLGVRAVYAIPLCIGAIRLGALDLYRREPGELTSAQLRSALLVADLAALSLLHLDGFGARAMREADVTAFRAEVHQATGMVKVQTGLTMQDALLLLRAHAFSEDEPVTDVANAVIAGRLRFPLEDP